MSISSPRYRSRFSLHYLRPLLAMAIVLGSSGWGISPMLADVSAPPGSIENTATGSFVDELDPTNTAIPIQSNKVFVTVVEVAGITVTAGGITGSTITGAIAYFDFVLTNVGNDPTQFFIPDAPSAISGGNKSGDIKIISYDPDGNGATAAVVLDVSVPAGGATTGTILSGVATANNGSIPVGATMTIRVPVLISATSGNVTVTMGDTPANGQNQPVVATPGLADIRTVDNPGIVGGDTSGPPLNGEREASLTQSLPVSTTTSSGNAPTVTCKSDRRIFNTAYSGNGGFFNTGRDTYWESAIGTSNLSTSGPIPTTGWINAYNVEAVKPTWAWIDSPYNDSAWISHFIDARHDSVGRVDVYFRYKFNLDSAVDVTSFQVKMDFFGDNSVTDIFINGVSQQASYPSILPQPQGGGDPYQYRGFEGSGRAALTLTRNWQTGPNEIVVQVKSDPGYMGLIAESQPSYLCKSDAGDAPTSYGDAAHTIISIPKVYLGNTPPDADPFGGRPSPGADGDTDDAFAVPLVAPIASTYNLTVPVTNTSGQPVKLYGWIDFNKDGKFGAGEYQSVSVPNNATTANLTWTIPSGTTIGNTYARFRLTSDTLTDNVATTDVDERANAPANDGEVEDYTVLLTQPNLLLVKRITAINGATTSGGVDLASYQHQSNNPYDDNLINIPAVVPPDTDKWPIVNSYPFMIGSVDGGNVKPNDSIEYTIYFLSAGNVAAKNVLFCDRVPKNVTFIPTAFNTITPDASGLATADRGIAVNLSGTLKSYTNIADGDLAQYFPPNIEPSSIYPKIACGGSNDNGAVVVNLGNLPNATVSGEAGTYGFVRFQGLIK
jgi:uncharacterized repeat protein (TIGR01451 family)